MCTSLCRFEEEQLKEVVIGATFKVFQVIFSKNFCISGNIGEELILVVWWSRLEPPKIIHLIFSIGQSWPARLGPTPNLIPPDFLNGRFGS